MNLELEELKNKIIQLESENNKQKKEINDLCQSRQLIIESEKSYLNGFKDGVAFVLNKGHEFPPF